MGLEKGTYWRLVCDECKQPDGFTADSATMKPNPSSSSMRPSASSKRKRSPMPAEQSNKGMKRLVQLTEREIEALATNRRWVGRQGDETNARHKLRAALDSPPVEEQDEFRVAGTNKLGEKWVSPNGDGVSLAEVQESAKEFAERGDWNPEVRIQSRTITTFSDGSTLYGPWTDLPGEGEQS